MIRKFREQSKRLLAIGRKPARPLKGAWAGLSILPRVEILVDVGIGPQGTPGLWEEFPSARKIFVDPLEESVEGCRHFLYEGSEHRFYCVALSDKSGSQEILVRHPLSRSGFHKQMDVPTDQVEVRTVPVTTVDELLRGIDLSGGVGLKIDTEGHELNIIRGAKSTLLHAKFVILELPMFGRSFEGVSSFEDAISVMKSLGFAVAAVRASGDGTDHCDVAFVQLGTAR